MRINLLIGKLACKVTKKHREPHQFTRNHIWRVEFCNRCGHVFKKEKIGRTFKEILNDVYQSSGNQIW